jgi:ParB-like chromosome segregation protein Spo0J
VRRSGVRQPLVVRVRPDGARVLLDGHHRAVAVLRRGLADSVPAVLVSCPCTMGCAFTAELLAEYRERASDDGWAQ